jgi:hypothetical protein
LPWKIFSGGVKMEPYYQILCEKGHYFESNYFDKNNPIDYNVLNSNIYKIKWKCPVCVGRLAWWNPVDIRPMELTQIKGTNPKVYLIPSRGGRKLEY